MKSSVTNVESASEAATVTECKAETDGNNTAQAVMIPRIRFFLLLFSFISHAFFKALFRFIKIIISRC